MKLWYFKKNKLNPFNAILKTEILTMYLHQIFTELEETDLNVWLVNC